MGSKMWGGYILKSILSIVPVYWFGLIIYWISVSFSEDGCTASALNIISHFLLFNGLTPTWWAGFMGGTGYFGVLVIMWVLYPPYLKRIKGMRVAVEFAIVTISCSYILMEFLKWINSKMLIDASGNMNDWIWYIFRGIYCYSIGCVVFFC